MVIGGGLHGCWVRLTISWKATNSTGEDYDSKQVCNVAVLSYLFIEEEESSRRNLSVCVCDDTSTRKRKQSSGPQGVIYQGFPTKLYITTTRIDWRSICVLFFKIFLSFSIE
jgi:hypothetical protein